MDIAPIPSIPNIDPYTIPFFHDFMLFLNRLVKQPIKRTATGNISLSDIENLLQQFKQQERMEEYKKYGWHLRREEELQFLTQIKNHCRSYEFNISSKWIFVFVEKWSRFFLIILQKNYNRCKKICGLHCLRKEKYGKITNNSVFRCGIISNFLLISTILTILSMIYC